MKEASHSSIACRKRWPLSAPPYRISRSWPSFLVYSGGRGRGKGKEIWEKKFGKKNWEKKFGSRQSPGSQGPMCGPQKLASIGEGGRRLHKDPFSGFVLWPWFPWMTQPMQRQSSPQGQLAVSPAQDSPKG